MTTESELNDHLDAVGDAIKSIASDPHHTTGRYPVGDLLVFPADADVTNPYTDERRIDGYLRVDALQRIRDRLAHGEFQLWFAPPKGGAKKITPWVVNWEGLR